MSLLFNMLCRLVIREGNGTPTPVLLAGRSHGWRSLVGCSPRGRWWSDTTKRLHFHFSLLCIGERNGNLLQCSCLENPRDEGAWWAAVYGVAQSQKSQLKWLSSSSRLVIAFLPRSKSLNFMAAVTIRSDFGAPQNKVSHCFYCFPIYLPWCDGTRCHDLSFLNVEF